VVSLAEGKTKAGNSKSTAPPTYKTNSITLPTAALIVWPAL